MNWIRRTLTKHDLSLASMSLASLAKKYGSTAQEITTKNGVPWSSNAINQWVLSVGGREVTPGNFSFTVGNKILLPEVAVIPDPNAMSPIVASQLGTGGVPWWGWLALGGGGLLLWRRMRKKKTSKKTAEPAIFRF